jgi:predicted deacylase
LTFHNNFFSTFTNPHKQKMPATINSPPMTQLPAFKSGKARAEKGYISPIPGITIPYGVFEGTETGPCLLVTSGVHGAEFCSIEAGLRLLQSDPKDFCGTLVVLPILNLQGFKARSIATMPEDGKNLNRAFPGRKEGTVSERLAAWLVEQVFPKVDAYVDLHGGDLTEEILPVAVFPCGSHPSRVLAEAFGLLTLVEVSTPSSTTIAAAAQRGVPSIIVEIGGNGLWNEAQVTQFAQGIRGVMTYLGMKPSCPVEERKNVVEILNLRTVTASQDGIWRPIKKLSNIITSGEVIGNICDVFGSSISTIKAEYDGVIIYRLTSLSVNEGDSLFGIGVK